MEQTSRFKIFRLAFSRKRRTGHDVESPSETRFWIFAPRRNGGFCVNLRQRRCSAKIWMLFLPWAADRSEEHTYELQSLMRISYDVVCLKKKTKNKRNKR